MATIFFSRTLPRHHYPLSNPLSFTHLSIAFKRTCKTSAFHSFASKHQFVIRARTKKYSTERTNRSLTLENKTSLPPDNVVQANSSEKTSNPILDSDNKSHKSQPEHTNVPTIILETPRNKSITTLPLVLVLAASALLSFYLYQYFTSSVNKYPEEIRKNLRKGLFYQNYRNDPNRAVNFYQTALTQAFNHKQLDNASPEVTGIMIQLGSLYEELGRIRDAIDVFTMAYDAISTPDNVPIKLEGENKIRLIALAQKLGDLHHSLKQNEQAEKYYVWSIEQLLQSQAENAQLNQLRNDNQSGIFSKRHEINALPSWMTLTDLGASLEALASFYASQHKYAYALPLYLRALSLINPPESSCHSAVLMNNIAEVFTGMGNLEEAQGWAERGLKLVENFRPKKKIMRECDESCGVLLFNLGMISELTGNLTKASEYYEKARLFAKRINFADCVTEADLALQRTTILLSEGEGK
ncbi:13911_t:CDS:2 [Gigaspora margarita]|uniref:TPR-like protein n=3 Tax=Gigaspora margarita TaxID=4874 RepID=A0A8H4AUE2_GIGMA|nr:TPR-like protein [Gigaspora margarita]CAG8796930.1 13911_t:CDS:2 [Gigaspora margarita]